MTQTAHGCMLTDLLCSIFSQFCFSVDGHERIVLHVTDFKVGVPVPAHMHLFSCTCVSFLFTGNDVTVRAAG